MSDMREIAVRILMEVEANDGKSHLLLADAWKKNPELTGQDRRFLLTLVQGTLEKQMLLDARINRKSKVPVKKMKPAIRQILRLGAYQIFFMDKVPAAAACNEAVKLTQKFRFQGLKGFVNGVLRSLAREENWPEEELSVQFSMPEWILGLWEEEYGTDATRAMLSSLNEKKQTFFRMDTGRQPEEKIRESLAAEGVTFHPAEFPADAWVMDSGERLEELTALKEGWIRIQDISSMMVGTLAKVQKGWKVLDVCAAPGGKTIHVAEQLEGTGQVIGCDLTDAKVALMDGNVKRSGLTNIRVMRQDATKHRPEWEGTFDLIIADLPCSGLGVIRRKPEIRYNVTQRQVEELAALQREILKNISSYLKPDGVLMFSTCTVSPQENRLNREWILENLPFTAAEFPKDRIPEQFASRCAGGQLQMLPGIDPCDGFYVSVYRKKERE